MPNSIRILYKTSLLTESYAFLKSTNNWCTAPLYSHLFSSIWRMQNATKLLKFLITLFLLRFHHTFLCRSPPPHTHTQFFQQTDNFPSPLYELNKLGEFSTFRFIFGINNSDTLTSTFWNVILLKLMWEGHVKNELLRKGSGIDPVSILYV
jgi:hypothetical protein